MLNNTFMNTNKMKECYLYTAKVTKQTFKHPIHVQTYMNKQITCINMHKQKML